MPCTVSLYMNYDKFLPLPSFEAGRLSSPQLPPTPLGAPGRLRWHLMDESVIATLKLGALTSLAKNNVPDEKQVRSRSQSCLYMNVCWGFRISAKKQIAASEDAFVFRLRGPTGCSAPGALPSEECFYYQASFPKAFFLCPHRSWPPLHLPQSNPYQNPQ